MAVSRFQVPSKFTARLCLQDVIRGLRGVTCAAVVAALAASASAPAFASAATLAAPYGSVCDAVEAPAESEQDPAAPQESSEPENGDEREAAPKQERNGKGGRRIRGSDQHADRRVMNA